MAKGSEESLIPFKTRRIDERSQWLRTTQRGKRDYEKLKIQLEAKNNEPITALTVACASRQEFARYRKQAESQLSEWQGSVKESEQSHAELTEKFTRLERDYAAMTDQFDREELALSKAVKQEAAAKSQLAEMKKRLAEQEKTIQRKDKQLQQYEKELLCTKQRRSTLLEV
ncbi:uncharacterized protein LOC110832341 [Zootermopsis nevadensis]|nr:uncharacterized protein LOC110832341 [Zootermopsis nevadensis]